MRLGELRQNTMDLTRQNIILKDGKIIAGTKNNEFLDDYYYEEQAASSSNQQQSATPEKKYQSFTNWYVGQGNDQVIKNIITECKQIIENYSGTLKQEAKEIHDTAVALYVKYQNWLVSGPTKNPKNYGSFKR